MLQNEHLSTKVYSTYFNVVQNNKRTVHASNSTVIYTVK